MVMQDFAFSPRAENTLMSRSGNRKRGGPIPYFKMGKAVRFRVADVAAAIVRMRIG
jgi:hypothetical protein